jgi:hypothetical protein
MSTDHNKKGSTAIRLPLHDDVQFEVRDVRTSIILKFLVGLAITLVISYLVTIGIYNGLTNYWTSSYAAPPPSHQGEGLTLPPEPRLQGMPGHETDPQQDWRDMQKADAAANSQLGWTDEKSGLARIPVKDAMDLIVEKGLPELPAVPEEKK